MKGILKYHEPLAPYTSWRIGGKADCYYRPSDAEDLALFLQSQSVDEPVTFLGLGSNVLISDAGLRGVVVHVLFTEQPRIDEGLVYAAAGVPCAKLAKFCIKHKRCGAEFFSGIPGTVGGALMMNAGAWGSQTWDHVVWVETINRVGKRFRRQPEAFTVGYRQVVPQHAEWFLGAAFRFDIGDPSVASKKVKHLLRKRSESQPIGVFSCGSVFQNPPDRFAAQLIESAGLKGTQIGGAQISDKHANFIINVNDARAEDVKRLIEHIQHVVFEKHQVKLEPEVKLMGFFD